MIRFEEYVERVFEFLGFVDKNTEDIGEWLQQWFMILFTIVILVTFVLPPFVIGYLYNLAKELYLVLFRR